MQLKRIVQTIAVLGSGTLVTATSSIVSAELTEVANSYATKVGHTGCSKSSGGNTKSPDQSKKQPKPNGDSHKKRAPENPPPNKKPKKKKGEDKCGQGTCG